MIKANAIKMAMKTDRNDTVEPLLNMARGTGWSADYITDATVRHNFSPVLLYSLAWEESYLS